MFQHSMPLQIMTAVKIARHANKAQTANKEANQVSELTMFDSKLRMGIKDANF